MPDVRAMYDKEFLFHYDLDGRDVTVQIERVKPGELTGEGGKKSKKPIVYFRGKTKGLALCITNVRIIGEMYGTFKADEWVGKWITLYPTTTTFGRNQVDCIRVRPQIPKRGGGHAEQEPEPQPSPSSDTNGDAS